MPNPTTIAMEDEYQDTIAKGTAENNRLHIEHSLELGQLKDEVSALKQSLSLLGRDRIEAIESRDRALVSNTELCLENREYKALARAARRFLGARSAFEASFSPTDAMTEEVANAEGDLILMLEKLGF